MPDNLIQLEQPVTEGGLESTNFFNGRLLTGSDFAREQAARASADRRLGQAMGSGVAFGLTLREGLAVADGEGATGRPVVVEPGLAVNALGQAMRLETRQLLHLTRPPAANSDGIDDNCTGFDDCDPLTGGTYVAGQGVYVLTIAPAQRRTGRAETNGLEGSGARCNIDQLVETVKFRLILVRPQLYGSLPATADDFRNRIAYRCFGDGVKANWVTHLLSQADRGDDLLEELSLIGLGRQEVPLGLLAYTGSDNLEFLDMWAVRRPLVRADEGSQIDSLSQPRRTAVGAAMLRQFDDHFADLVGPDGIVGDTRARSHFPYLPPAGILPYLDEAAARKFLGGMTIRGLIHINGPQVEPLMRESLSAPALKTSDNEVIWLYAVAQNRIEGQLATAADDRSDPYLIFARGDLAYRGDARFNLHRWDYANFALGG